MIRLFSTDSSHAGKAVFWVHRTRYAATYPRIAWNHATANGGPVLKTDVGWRNVNGILFRLGGAVTWVTFRRFWRL
jgi:hypothetical protein